MFSEMFMVRFHQGDRGVNSAERSGRSTLAFFGIA